MNLNHDHSRGRVRKNGRRHLNCLHDHDDRFRLLELAEIMAVAESDDASFTLKVLAAAFEVLTDHIITEYGDPMLPSEVLDLCESNIRHGYTLALGRVSPDNDGAM